MRKIYDANTVPSLFIVWKQCAQGREKIQKEQDCSPRKPKKSKSGINSQQQVNKQHFGLCERADRYH